MRKIILSLALALASAGVSSGQNPALAKFFGQLEDMNDKVAAAVASDDKAAIESVYMEIAALYDQQPRDVRDAVMPMMSGVWYNIACMRSLQKNVAGALEALSKAVDYGWKDYSHTMSDPDLAAVRNDPRFKEIVAKIR